MILTMLKKRGVCACFKETLGVHFLQTNLDQFTVSEITFNNKTKGYVISLNRLPSQIPD